MQKGNQETGNINTKSNTKSNSNTRSNISTRSSNCAKSNSYSDVNRASSAIYDQSRVDGTATGQMEGVKENSRTDLRTDSRTDYRTDSKYNKYLQNRYSRKEEPTQEKRLPSTTTTTSTREPASTLASYPTATVSSQRAYQGAGRLVSPGQPSGNLEQHNSQQHQHNLQQHQKANTEGSYYRQQEQRRDKVESRQDNTQRRDIPQIQHGFQQDQTSTSHSGDSSETENDAVLSNGSPTPRLPQPATQPTKQCNTENSSANKHRIQRATQQQQPGDLVPLQQQSSSESSLSKYHTTSYSTEGEATPNEGTISRQRTDSSSFSRVGSDRTLAAASRSSSADRSRLIDADRKFQKFEKGPPVCVCSAAPFYERERVNMEKRKAQLKEEAEAIRKDIVLHRQQRQQLTDLFLNVESAEECVKRKEEALKSREAALKEGEEKVEQRESQSRLERNEVEELRSDVLLKEKDLDIKNKRYEREFNELKNQVESQKRESARLDALENQICIKEAQLIDEEKIFRDLKTSVDEQRKQLSLERRQFDKRNSELADAEMEAVKREAKLQRITEDLKIKENSLGEREEELDNLKAVNEICDQALKNKSAQLENALEDLYKQQEELNDHHENFNEEVQEWKSKSANEEMQRNEEYNQKTQSLNAKLQELEEKDQHLSEKERALEDFEAELDRRVKQLEISEAQLSERRSEETKRNRQLSEMEIELKRKSASMEVEKQKSLKRVEAVEKKEAESEARRLELLQAKEDLRTKIGELEKKEKDVEQRLEQIERREENLDIRESVIHSQEKRSVWHRSVMQEVVDQKEHLELVMQAFEAEKQAFDELRAVAAAQHDKMNKTIRAREEALARLDISIHERVKDMHRQEALLENRVAENSGALKHHKLLTVSRPSDNPVVRQADRLCQTASSPLPRFDYYSAPQHRMPLLSLYDMNPSARSNQGSASCGGAAYLPAGSSSTRMIRSAEASSSSRDPVVFASTIDLTALDAAGNTAGQLTADETSSHSGRVLPSQRSNRSRSDANGKKRKNSRKRASSKSASSCGKSPQKKIHQQLLPSSESPGICQENSENVPPNDFLKNELPTKDESRPVCSEAREFPSQSQDHLTCEDGMKPFPSNISNHSMTQVPARSPYATSTGAPDTGQWQHPVRSPYALTTAGPEKNQWQQALMLDDDPEDVLATSQEYGPKAPFCRPSSARKQQKIQYSESEVSSPLVSATISRSEEYNRYDDETHERGEEKRMLQKKSGDVGSGMLLGRLSEEYQDENINRGSSSVQKSRSIGDEHTCYNEIIQGCFNSSKDRFTSLMSENDENNSEDYDIEKDPNAQLSRSLTDFVDSPLLK